MNLSTLRCLSAPVMVPFTSEETPGEGEDGFKVHGEDETKISFKAPRAPVEPLPSGFRLVREDEVLQPGAHVRMNVETGETHILDAPTPEPHHG